MGREIKIGLASKLDFENNDEDIFEFYLSSLYGSVHSASGETKKYLPKVQKGALITLHINTKKGSIGFSVNGLFKGVAFKSEKIEYNELFLTVEMSDIGQMIMVSDDADY